MFCGTLALVYPVGTVGVGHVLKLFAVLYQLVHQTFGILKVHIIVAGAVDV